jgi:hypothetical protein
VVEALANVLLIVDQSPLIVVLVPLNKPTAARAMKAKRSEYSTKSCPSSSLQNFFKLII